MVFVRSSFSDNAAPWWQNFSIKRDHRYDPAGALAMLPDELRAIMLLNKVTANREWEDEHLAWLEDNCSSMYFMEKCSVFFHSPDDLTMFCLQFA
jgi:hypothetical protein